MSGMFLLASDGDGLSVPLDSQRPTGPGALLEGLSFFDLRMRSLVRIPLPPNVVARPPPIIFPK